ncbi:MAG: YaiO family outer membrane beta-barrel protein [Lysobacter sp.]|nr:MAG: YaiO family outer membrane beta-barrel protein [Lysobacter sp.]
MLKTTLNRQNRKAAVLGVLLCAAAPLPAWADGVVNVGIDYQRLTNGFGEWNGLYVRGSAWQRPQTVFNYELVSAKRFGDQGTFGSLGIQHTFNSVWYGTVTAGAGASTFIFPRWTADATVSRKWLPRGQLVTTVGAGTTRATDGHRDVHGLLSAAWYASDKWVFEAGWRPNHSDPGAVRSGSAFAAATWGREGRQYWIVRHDVGREAYQLIGDNTALVDFPSRSTSLAWRKWWSARCGTHVQVEHYGNPNYERNGVQFAAFCNH